MKNNYEIKNKILRALIESQYFPPIATFSILKNYKSVQFDYHSYYEKGSYRNRCHICGANGMLRLSVPLVKGKHQKTPLGDVRISYDENWRKNHWHSILSAYGRSAFFEFYQPELKEIFFTDYERLVELNKALFDFVCKEMNIDIQVEKTTEYINTAKEIDDYRNTITPKINISNLNIEPKAYEQVFANQLDFIPNLSIIDLLFTQGPMSRDYL